MEGMMKNYKNLSQDSESTASYSTKDLLHMKHEC